VITSRSYIRPLLGTLCSALYARHSYRVLSRIMSNENNMVSKIYFFYDISCKDIFSSVTIYGAEASIGTIRVPLSIVYTPLIWRLATSLTEKNYRYIFSSAASYDAETSIHMPFIIVYTTTIGRRATSLTEKSVYLKINVIQIPLNMPSICATSLNANLQIIRNVPQTNVVSNIAVRVIRTTIHQISPSQASKTC